MQSNDRSASLVAFGGTPAPAGLARDLESLTELPAAVQENLWAVLEHNLGAELGPGVQAYVEQFCRDHDIVPDVLVPVVRAVRLLFRAAAARDVAPADVTRDLNLICGTQTAIVKRVSEWYERALPFIRTMTVFDGLDDFGPVLEDVRIRTSYVPVSKHHPTKMLPLTTMAVTYRDAETGASKRLALQLSPQGLERVKKALGGAT